MHGHGPFKLLVQSQLLLENPQSSAARVIRHFSRLRLIDNVTIWSHSCLAQLRVPDDHRRIIGQPIDRCSNHTNQIFITPLRGTINLCAIGNCHLESRFNLQSAVGSNDQAFRAAGVISGLNGQRRLKRGFRNPVGIKTGRQLESVWPLIVRVSSSHLLCARLLSWKGR
jgi:hypothetical protein